MEKEKISLTYEHDACGRRSYTVTGHKDTILPMVPRQVVQDMLPNYSCQDQNKMIKYKWKQNLLNMYFAKI